MRTGRALLLLLAGLSLAGCAELTNLTRVRDIAPNRGNGQAILIDAKQRAIVSARGGGSRTTYAWNPTTKAYDTATVSSDETLRICAEPSPDALSAIAASQGLNLDQASKLSVGGSSSLAEAAGSIGLRTQSIQLMRDEMYHLCEGYLSGGLSKLAFESMHHRLQSSMVAILAIEQLTGAVKAQQIVLTGQASTGAADAIQKLTQSSADALTALRTAQSDQQDATDKLATLQKALDDATKAGGDMPDDAAKKKIADATTARDAQAKVVDDDKKKTADKQAAYDAIESGRKAALSGVSGASTQGAFGAGGLDPASAAAVAGAVKEIVTNTLELRFSHDLCVTVLLAEASGEVAPTSEVLAECKVLLANAAKSDTNFFRVSSAATPDTTFRAAADADLARKLQNLPSEPSAARRNRSRRR